MSLLEKYSEKLSKSSDGIENVRVKVQDIYVVSTADDNSWKRIGVKTDKGTFYGFESCLTGAKVGDFMPESGMDAMITIREREYTDKDGKQAFTLDLIGCKVDVVGYRAGILKGTGLVVNLF